MPWRRPSSSTTNELASGIFAVIVLTAGAVAIGGAIAAHLGGPVAIGMAGGWLASSPPVITLVWYIRRHS